ncbi:MAG: phosphate/phosphite/phosphonate ABC transporter substrate-binding protein [Candidatus Omnitrophota bacterium]|nr:phosphate/phosphite/phosphonate ABC transporter substrate-binding protein [Candidatus Omnitrophota bacterium]
MRIFKVFIGVFLLFGLSFFFGCNNEQGAKKIDLDKTEELNENLPEPNQLRIGIIPEQDIRKMAARYEPLAEYLGKKLNLKVTLVYLDNYGEVCDKFISQQLDAAFFGSFSYALTHAKAGVEALSRPDYQGVSTYRGLIIVRKDGNIKDLPDMRNKRLALVHRATYAGYLYPLYYFKEHKVADLDLFFSQVIFSGSHDKAIIAVLNGQADIAVPKDLVYERMLKDNPDLENKLLILSASKPVPSNAFCVRKGLGLSLKDRLKNILLNLENEPEAGPVLVALGASRFIETNDKDYANLYEIIKALKIDLDTYPYYERQDIG